MAITLTAVSCAKHTPADAAETPKQCSVVGSIPYWAQQEAFDSFLANHEHIDHLSLFWYHLAPNGSVRPYRRTRERPDLVKKARALGVKVFGLVANLPDDEREGSGLTWDAQRVRKVIHSRARRTEHVKELVALAHRMQFDGILIDYEALPRSQRSNFSAFIQQLGAALRADGLLLAVAIHPKTSEHDPRETNGSEAQDWDVLARSADQLHFMTYSQHTGDTPGPVASLPWVERVLRYAVEKRKLPRAKIFVGLPLYAEEWSEQASGKYRGLDVDLTFGDVRLRRKTFGGSEQWSDEHQSPYLTYRDRAGTEHVVWFENQRSSKQKLALARSLGLCNLALWRLGGEDPGLWDALRELRSKQRATRKPPKARRAAWRQPAAKRDGGGELDDDEEQDVPPAPDKAAEAEVEAAVAGAEPAATGGPAPDADADRDVGDETGRQVDAGAGADDAAAESSAPASDGGAVGSTAEVPVERSFRLLGLKTSGSLSAEVEYYNKFAFDEPEHERYNVLSSISFVQTVAFTERLELHQDVRAVLESDGEDRRYYSDYPHRGIYLRSLLLAYKRGPVAVFGGKYEPADGLRSRKAIFFGNYSTNLDLYGQLGGGAALGFEGERAGRHTLTGHVFRRDTSRLRGEILSDQGRDYDYFGEVGEYGPPDSYLITLDGERPWRDVPHGYALGGGKQTRGMYRDQHVLFGCLFGGVPLRREHVLELSLDAMYLRNAYGGAENRTILGAGVDYAHPRFSVGAAYSVRFVAYTDAMAEHTERTDQILEVVARVPITSGWFSEAAYQRSAEWGVTENAIGVVLEYVVDWGED